MATTAAKDKLTGYTAAGRVTHAAHSLFLATLGVGAKIARGDLRSLFADLVEQGEQAETRAKATAYSQTDTLEHTTQSYLSSIWKRLGGASLEALTQLSGRVQELDRSIKELKALQESSASRRDLENLAQRLDKLDKGLKQLKTLDKNRVEELAKSVKELKALRDDGASLEALNRLSQRVEELDKALKNLGVPDAHPQREGSTHKIDLNTASADQLKQVFQLPDERAADLLRRRDELGGFKSWEDVNQVPGFGEGMIENMKEAGFAVGADNGPV